MLTLGRHLFQRWCEAAGMTMGVDTMGNMFATRPGTDPAALPVYMGSHLDTQPTGGKYDGVLGVLGALEVVRSMNDLGIKTKHPVVVTNWTNEEGARFAPAMLASGVFAGIHTEDYAKGRRDMDGKLFGEELKRIGWEGTEKVGARKMKAFFELHIEQGPILENTGNEIGVVTLIQGMRRFYVDAHGEEAHSGTTPLRLRKELLVRDPASGLYPVLRERTPVRMDLTHCGWSDIFFLGMDFPEGARVLNVSIDLGVHGRDAAPQPPVEAYFRVIDEPVIRLASVDLEAEAHLDMECQRCLHPVREHLVVSRSIRFARDEAEAARLDAEYDTARLKALIEAEGREKP